MRKRYGVILTVIGLILFSGEAWGKERLSYKDIHIGMPEDEALNKLKNWKDPTYTKEQENYERVGDIRVRVPALRYDDGKVVQIAVSLQDQRDYEVFREALIDKWGKPTDTSRKEFQNRLGAKSYRIMDLWIFPEGTVTYSISPEGFVLYTLTERAYGEKQIESLKSKRTDRKEGL